MHPASGVAQSGQQAVTVPVRGIRLHPIRNGQHTLTDAVTVPVRGIRLHLIKENADIPF